MNTKRAIYICRESNSSTHNDLCYSQAFPLLDGYLPTKLHGITSYTSSTMKCCKSTIQLVLSSPHICNVSHGRVHQMIIRRWAPHCLGNRENKNTIKRHYRFQETSQSHTNTQTHRNNKLMLLYKRFPSALHAFL
jgi:hypothetical protein